MIEKLRLKTAIFLPSLFFILFMTPSLAQDMESLNRGIVRISAKTLEGGKKIGTGFVVQFEENYVHIATAAHVVEGAREVEVEFYARRNRAIPALVIDMEGADPQGLAALSAEGKIPLDLRVLKMNDAVTLQVGDPVIMLGFSDAGSPLTTTKAKSVDLNGKSIALSGPVAAASAGGLLIKEGQVIGVLTEVKETSASATPAVIARYVLESWGVVARQQETLARTLVAESVALWRRAQKRGPEEFDYSWSRLMEQEERADFLQRSLLLAVESMRRVPSIDAENALRSGLTLLTRPIAELEGNGTAFSPDGRYLSIASVSTARLYETQAGKETARLFMIPSSVGSHSARMADTWAQAPGRGPSTYGR
jgi:hypothetical protein